MKGTLGYWASTLSKPKAAGSALIEVGRSEVTTEASVIDIRVTIPSHRHLLILTIRAAIV